jgi:oxygen-independent coproporphyrinogen-3 oxidase
MAGIYIHVPFCKTRCIYCDFFTGTDLSYKEDYVRAVCEEISLRERYLGGDTIKTIYFGGGTPSLFNKSDFEKIFQTINSTFKVESDAEITLEANPDDLSDEYLNDLKCLSFNRISIGIQSFNDKELEFLNRRHSADKAKEAVRRCQKLGFDNISIDLMYGLPDQTIDSWISNLEKAIDLNIQHISAYHLIYEEDTMLYKLLQQNKIRPVNEDLSVEMFSIMIDKLSAAGFIHYEISNFAKDACTSKHNSSYWLGEKYLGLGAAAHSYNGDERAWNIASIGGYIQGIGNENPNIEIEHSDVYTRYNEYIMTGLRTMWGVDLEKLEHAFGKDLLDYCLRNVSKYIDMQLVVETDNILKLTKKGIFVSDDIMSELMYVR